MHGGEEQVTCGCHNIERSTLYRGVGVIGVPYSCCGTPGERIVLAFFFVLVLIPQDACRRKTWRRAATKRHPTVLLL